MISRPAGSVTAAFLFTILFDQISKQLSSQVVLNTGVSFGLFSGPLLTLLLIGIFIAIAFSYGKTFVQISPIATGFFSGGAFSNILDRVIYGGVRDFLPVPLLGIRNNLADWCIILSLLWIFLHSSKASFSKTTHSSSSTNQQDGS
jgi:lipoprotein signal peptidase